LNNRLLLIPRSQIICWAQPLLLQRQLRGRLRRIAPLSFLLMAGRLGQTISSVSTDAGTPWLRSAPLTLLSSSPSLPRVWWFFGHPPAETHGPIHESLLATGMTTQP